MNRRLIIWAAGIAACAGLVTVAGKTRAGFKSSQAVVISEERNFANADLGYAHNTPNTVEYMYCSVNTTLSGASVSCYAKNSAGLSKGCSSSDADLVAAARSIASDSHLIFSWNDDSGACTRISVSKGSIQRPKSF